MGSWRPGWWNYNYTVLLITWLGWISIYLARSVLPPVLPLLIEELGITHTQSGLLETSYLLGYILVKMPAGSLSNRYGARRVLSFSMIGYGVSTLLISQASGFLGIFTLRFLVGLFQGVHLPVANALLSERFGDKQNRAIGFNESGANVGNTLAFPMTVSIVSLWSWRTAFLILSIPAFLLSIATMFLLKPEKETKEEKEETRGSKLADYSRILVPLALSHATYNLILRTTFTFMPSFLVEFRGMDYATAGLLATVLPFAGIFAKLSSGFIVERVGQRKAIVGASSLSAFFLAFLVLFPIEAYLPLNLILLGLTLYCFSPIVYSSTTASLPSELKAVGLGAVTMFGNFVGAISTSVVGALIDSQGYSYSFVAIAVVTVFSSLLIQVTMKE